MANQLQVGQKLWFVPMDERDVRFSKEVEIIAIGRKWATLSNNHRIDMTTLMADGRQYSSPGKCWLCKEDWERDVLAQRMYTRLVNRAGFRPREGVTLGQIQQAASLLGVTLEN